MGFNTFQPVFVLKSNLEDEKCVEGNEKVEI